ncbi:substrate-binding domain-containing protein [Rhodobacteraceae bacterium D3-12]|nr:substrate-binding domain-containing protein [Rhodobacteraceae bacterium D3-12]
MTNMPRGTVLPMELSDLRSGRWLRESDHFRVALMIPLCGSAGLWAPSCISSAQVAVAELNKAGGILGRKVQLIMVDAAVEAPEPVEVIVNDLIETKAIDAIVGMHISAIRQRLSKVVRQRIPYIYTPLYEGGERTPGLYTIGETPDEQLAPAMTMLQSEYRPKSWALIGNDYVWPRSSHSYAKGLLKDMGIQLAMERYVPFGLRSMEPLMEELDRSGAEAVLMTLVGQDAVNFNRAFGRANMHQKMVRLSCAMEENGLLACGAKNLQRLFTASSYFGVLPTEANSAFKERYHTMHGEQAPVLNALGQSTYEGMQFLAGLMGEHHESWHLKGGHDPLPVLYKSGRQNGQQSAVKHKPIYLARADGLQFHIIKEFKNSYL